MISFVFCLIKKKGQAVRLAPDSNCKKILAPVSVLEKKTRTPLTGYGL